jgi:large subunit ribosomal protein L29
MNIREIRELSDEKLFDQLEDLKESLFNLRFQKAFGQLEDPSAIRYARRDVAKVLTVMHERNLKAQPSSGKEGKKNG